MRFGQIYPYTSALFATKMISNRFGWLMTTSLSKDVICPEDDPESLTHNSNERENTFDGFGNVSPF